MTREEAIKMLRGMKAENLNLANLYTKDKYNALDMAIKALETVEEFEKAQIITGGRLNGRTYAYKCGLEDGKRKALEQEPILEKIRAEIVNLTNGDTPERIWNVDVLNIIDSISTSVEMTREEAIKIFNTVLFFGKCDCPKKEIEECLKMAIKALEQEPILDEIRAEIEAIEDGISSYHNDRPWIFKDEALAIIDKYKAESEDKE